MKKSIWAMLALTATLLVTACSQVTQYNISEKDVNDYLQKHNNYQKKIGVPGLIDADIVLTNLQSQIGRSTPNKVTVSGHAKINITSLIGPQTADMQLTLQAQPVFDKASGAIYLKEMELVDYQVEPKKMDTIMQALTPYLNQSLKAYFDLQPAYVLDGSHSNAEAVAKKLASGLEVKPGALVVHFGD